MDGIDEERCEELEYNECEPDEYRCQDGSCIPEAYWLDGQYDCSDRSDEQLSGVHSYFSSETKSCPITSSRFLCDEGTASYEYFACGDGEFAEESEKGIYHCYNYRFNMFFCELFFNSWDRLPKWTLEDGHCTQKSHVRKNLTDMDELEKCVVYLKCKLTANTTADCADVISHFDFLCINKTINYPSRPIFQPYVQTVYQVSKLNSSLTPTYVLINGSIKCGGYHTRFSPHMKFLTWSDFVKYHPSETFFCNTSQETDGFSPQINEYCWNGTKQSFLCQKSLHCISKHRLRNGIRDCKFGEDEDDSQICYMTKPHRFKCSGKPSLCLVVSKIGDSYIDCNEGDDEYIAQFKWRLFDRKCSAPSSDECHVLKAYIHSPVLVMLIKNIKVLLFRQYCDTLWQLPRGFDESLCNEWKCSRDQYQCLSGHCISEHLVSNPFFAEWNCPDASDKIGILKIANLSEHNTYLISDLKLESIKSELIYMNNDSAFTMLCNVTEEYGCVLANVDDPLNFTLNRPCIHLTQIGDGITNCYGGLDERNLLTCGNNVLEQRGFDFHCNDRECIPYHRLCERRCSNKNDSILCDQLDIPLNSSCKYSSYHDFCTASSSMECDISQISNYYCDKSRLRKLYIPLVRIIT
jgi:hypothetical protein